MKKIVITIQAASDGGAFIVMDPGVDELLHDVDTGRGTSAHGYALTAYKAIKDRAVEAVADGAQLEVGEIPPQTH